MSLSTKIEQAVVVIDVMLRRHGAPMVFWSGGKDSMALLHLVRQVAGRDNIPVACFRDPWDPRKLKFINRMIDEWNIIAHDWVPSASRLCRKNGKIDVLAYYQINAIQPAQHIMVARNVIDPDPSDVVCGLETFLARPLGTFNFPWDCMFIGHKSADDDPTFGNVKLKADWIQVDHAGSMVFPLRNWTDDDVFDYHARFDIPLDEDRYDLKTRSVKTKISDSNPDYYRACLRCCDPLATAYVHCPKYKVEVNNVSHRVAWANPDLGYCNIPAEEKSVP
jgi:hypothetical protein